MLILCCSVATMLTEASAKTYTKESPLVYEDSWNLWPYSFINNNGEPDGFNIEIIDYVCRQLGIPYTVKLCDARQAKEHLRNDKADLTICVKQDANAAYGMFGSYPVTTFSHSMLTPRRDSLDMVHLSDLEMFYFSVHEGSISHYYLSRSGFDQQMNLVDNMEELVRRVGARDSGAVVWNTVSLRWLHHKYNLQNLTLSPVSIPDGAFHFLANDERLLHRLDSILQVMGTNGELRRISDNWLVVGNTYQEGLKIPVNITLCIVALAVLVIVLSAIYFYSHRKAKNALDDVLSEMELLMLSCNTDVWIFDPTTHKYAWMNSRGEVGRLYSKDEFAYFYAPGTMDVIAHAVDDILSEEKESVAMTIGSNTDKWDNSRTMQLRMNPLRDEYKHIYLVVGLQTKVQ